MLKHHSIIPIFQYSTHKFVIRGPTNHNHTLPNGTLCCGRRGGFCGIVDIRTLDHSFAFAARRHLSARLVATPPAAAAAFRRLAFDRISIRAARAFSRAGFSAARVGRKAPAIPYDSTSVVDDGGAAASFTGRAGVAFAPWIAATRFTTWTQVRFRFGVAPAAGALSDPSLSLPVCFHGEHRRMAFAGAL